MTAGPSLGSKPSRIDGVANILTSNGSEGNVQPVRKAECKTYEGVRKGRTRKSKNDGRTFVEKSRIDGVGVSM